MLQCTELRDERSFCSDPASDQGGTDRHRQVKRHPAASHPIFLILALRPSAGQPVASAEPAAITKAKSEAAALQARIDELADQLDAAVEEYNYAKAKLSETKAAAEDNQAKLAMAEADLEVLQGRLAERVVEIYKQGNLGTIATLAESASFSDLVNRLDLIERLSEQDSQILADVLAYQGRGRAPQGRTGRPNRRREGSHRRGQGCQGQGREAAGGQREGAGGQRGPDSPAAEGRGGAAGQAGGRGESAAEEGAAAKKARWPRPRQKTAKQQSSSKSSSRRAPSGASTPAVQAPSGGSSGGSTEDRAPPRTSVATW